MAIALQEAQFISRRLSLVFAVMLMIRDSRLMITGAGAREVATAFLYVYLDDCDAAFTRAVDLGARVVEDPVETPYGDRRCMAVDAWGNTWQIASLVR